MKRTLFIATAAIVLVGCDPSGEMEQSRKTNELTKQATTQVGMPGITKFTERRQLREIYELRDNEKLICYAYLEDLSGKLHFFTKCMGYGIPYATQFTNPGSTGGQAEPNALYMPSSAEGTWLMVPDEKGEPRPVYCEPRVVVSPIRISTAEGNPIE